MPLGFELFSQEAHLEEMGWKLQGASLAFGPSHCDQCSCGNNMMEASRACYPRRMIGNGFFGLVVWVLRLQHLPCGTQPHRGTELDVL